VVLSEKGKGYVALFDSGVGGLTVLKALKERGRGTSFLYLGDTARLPYGTKSPQTVERYTREALRFLFQFPIKAVVIACNTASALALPRILSDYTGVPIFGVVDPLVRSALKVTRTRHVAVLATEATIRSRAYELSLLRHDPELKVYSCACPLFVPLVEEGLFEGKVADVIISHYLEPLRSTLIDTVLLGCTHYPLLRSSLQKFFKEGVTLVDSALALAEEMEGFLDKEGEGETLYFTTDDPERFSRLGSQFLGERVDRVEVVSLDLYSSHLVDAVDLR
jgi:glutamate racemase